MNTISSTSKAFFKPYIGPSYNSAGFFGKKILVIGASFYCDKTECLFFKNCTDEQTKDSSRFDEICPEYNKSEHFLLSDTPTYELEDGKAYKRFGNSLSKAFFGSRLRWDEVWEMLSFTNYVQFILPHWKTLKRNISSRDLEAFKEVVDAISPDIIIVWGALVNEPIKRLAQDESTKIRTGDYLCHWKHGGKNIAIVNPYHPSSSAFFEEETLASFTEALREALNE